MALLVLISTLSISIEKHYCGEHLVDIALFSEAENCGMESSQDKDGESLMASSCCKDVVDLIEGQDELSLEKSEQITHSQKVFLVSYAIVFGGILSPEAATDPPFRNYNPPEVIPDIQVLNEVFLI